jgi:hypothetical protein
MLLFVAVVPTLSWYSWLASRAIFTAEAVQINNAFAVALRVKDCQPVAHPCHPTKEILFLVSPPRYAFCCNSLVLLLLL